jgi:hypothetical protein
MLEQLARLRAMTNGLLPPAARSEITTLESVLGGAVPEQVGAIYADHAAMTSERWWAMRLLSPAEVAEAIVGLRMAQLPIPDDELGVFWTDDNSNYAGVFLRGPLEGRVFTLDHEEPSPAPVFVSVESFYSAMLEAADQARANGESIDDHALKPDYPRRTSSDPSRPDDDDVARRLLSSYWAQPGEPDGERAAFQGIALSSNDDNELLVELFSVDDMFVAEAAARTVGLRRWSPAVPALAQLARGNLQNGRLAAILALKAIGDRPARQALEALRRELPSSYELYFR